MWKLVLWKGINSTKQLSDLNAIQDFPFFCCWIELKRKVPQDVGFRRRWDWNHHGRMDTHRFCDEEEENGHAIETEIVGWRWWGTHDWNWFIWVSVLGFENHSIALRPKYLVASSVIIGLFGEMETKKNKKKIVEDRKLGIKMWEKLLTSIVLLVDDALYWNVLNRHIHFYDPFHLFRYRLHSMGCFNRMSISCVVVICSHSCNSRVTTRWMSHEIRFIATDRRSDRIS